MQEITSSTQRDVLKCRGVDPDLVLSVVAIVVVVVVVEEVVVDLAFCGAGLVSKVVSSEDCSCTSVNIKKTIIVEVCRTVTNMPPFVSITRELLPDFFQSAYYSEYEVFYRFRGYLM